MSAAVAFTALTHRPTSRAFGGDDYIDEPCSEVLPRGRARQIASVSGPRQSDNVIYANFVSPSAAATAVTPTRLRLTRRGRRVIAVLVALPIVIAAFAFALNGGGAVATAESSTNTFSYITVQSGESLWQLAQAIAPTADPRDVIAEIVSLNQIQGDIHPGQRLAIPAGF
jgi:LysM repeat protein